MPAEHAQGLTRVERFMAHLDVLSGGLEPAFYPVGSTHEGLGRLTAITYRDLPDPGMTTTITYGLSLADHEEWRHGKPELCISVASEDVAWGLACATIGESLRGQCPFCYGDTIDFGERISDESQMTAFVIFAPAVLPRDSYADIDVGEDRPVHIAGCYPIHDSERHFIHENGLEAFWRGVEWDPFDVTRPPAV
jgi:hypothetical protein